MKCLIKRTGALGDVLLTTPIVKRLAQEGNQVSVWTRCPDVFKRNPYISPVDMARDPEVKFFDLDLAYEKKPKCHIIDAYSEVVFGDRSTEHKIYYYHDKSSPVLPLQSYVVIHPGISWENRTFTKSFWLTTAALLCNLGYKVAGVGTKQEALYSNTFYSSFFGTDSLSSLFFIIKYADLFIGPDSGLLHLAQATSVPCIGLFTCAKPEYRITSPKCYPIVPDIECHGCLHEAEPPVTYIGCKRGDLKCLDLITPEMVVEKAKEILQQR